MAERFAEAAEAAKSTPKVSKAELGRAGIGKSGQVAEAVVQCPLFLCFFSHPFRVTVGSSTWRPRARTVRPEKRNGFVEGHPIREVRPEVRSGREEAP